MRHLIQLESGFVLDATQLGLLPERSLVMSLPPHVINLKDEDGNPAGGEVRSVGLAIDWQSTPLGRGAEQKEPTGAFVEDVVQAAIQRLAFYQASKFSCRENAIALTHLETALLWLNKRTADREARAVEGTHEK